MSRIVATGAYVPNRVVNNTELIESHQLDSSDEWIQQRTGIKQRHFAAEEESVGSLATKASENLLSKLSDDIRQQIRLIIVASMSTINTTPSTANKVQMNIDAPNAWCLDVNAACSGFIYALEVAEKISRDYTSGYTLVIGAEKMSQILDFSDRGTAILFGDGAGAVLIENDGKGLMNYDSQLFSHADPSESIAVKPNETQCPIMTMLGREVFNFVQRKVIPSLNEFAQKHQPVDYIVSHQANYRFLEIIARKLKIDLALLPTNIAEVGNMSAASVPVLLDELVNNKQIRLDGSQSIILTGFGAGLSWGDIYLTV